MTDPADAYLTAMYDQAHQHLAHTIHAATRAVFDADGFQWNHPATRATIAARFRSLADDTDLADGIATVICATYADHGFPHDPSAVRQAVARQLARAEAPRTPADPEGHETSPQDRRP